MRRRRFRLFLALPVILLTAGASRNAGAQDFQAAGTEFTSKRAIEVPSGQLRAIIVTQFFHHGQIAPDGGNMAVVARNKQLVPHRVLQLGPGDYCRLAIQTIPGQYSYEVYYGGEAPAGGTVPRWTATEGLLLEIREHKPCDPSNLDSMRKAFESARPIGADYVNGVQHSGNPLSLKEGPFLSRYSGYLHVPTAGRYGFLTSARDACLLAIDGKVVDSRRGLLRRATRGTRKDVRLTAEAHKFEYYHVGGGEDAVMVAAWEVAPTDPKPNPAEIPPEAFRAGSVGRVQAGYVQKKDERFSPDFLMAIPGDVPLPDNNLALIRVQFRDVSPRALTMASQVAWDFGDGQTSTQQHPTHIYLRPGLYKVRLSAEYRRETFETVNEVYVDRPKLFKPKPEELDKLEDYLEILTTYRPEKLDAAGVKQLVLAFLARADQLQNEADELRAKSEELKGNSRELTAESEDFREKNQLRDAQLLATEAKAVAAQAEQVLAQAKGVSERIKQVVATAAAAGKFAFVEGAAAQGDEELLGIARLVGPLLRDRLGDSQEAFKLWKAAYEKINRDEIKAECAVEAADIAINDLLDPASARPLLTAARSALTGGTRGTAACRMHYVWGDYYAAQGEAEAAREAYSEAESLLGATRKFEDRIAWRGAYSRSSEEFLNTGELDRAVGEIRAWARDFPAERMDGYLTLCYARYWEARKMYAQAIAQAEQLLVVSPDSPYADRLLLLSARCDVERGKVDRAIATLKSLLEQYPGSPLVPEVREIVTKLESGQTGEAGKPGRGR